jgi:hypothetical protein
LKIIILFIVSVHAFLQDEDYVLDQIDTTKAEEKCLMLIKKCFGITKNIFFGGISINLEI